MNLDEARKVIWLKSNPRPLGELLDEGYLTQGRLEWAAQYAYSSRLKQAAEVLLESMKVSVQKPGKKTAPAEPPLVESGIPIGITLEKARATLWPLPPYKGQLMGMLIESKLLSLKDLGYAIENAWDENVRRAAIALTLVRLEQIVKEPGPSDGYVHIVSGGRSYAERKQLWLAMLEGAALGFLLILIILGVALTILTAKPAENSKSISEVLATQTGVIALVIVVVGAIALIAAFNFMLDQLFNRLEKQIEAHRLGQEGEEKTVQLIVQALDGNWSLFRNISLPGRNKADLDLVLVGPPGVWVLEVKNLRGQYRNVGENWDFRRGKAWKKASVNPSRQALNGAVRLSNFLKADNINVFVNPAIVWANGDSPLAIENPSVAVWSYDRLPDELGNIWQSEKLSLAERGKIAGKLSKLSEKKARVEE